MPSDKEVSPELQTADSFVLCVSSAEESLGRPSTETSDSQEASRGGPPEPPPPAVWSVPGPLPVFFPLHRQRALGRLEDSHACGVLLSVLAVIQILLELCFLGQL